MYVAQVMPIGRGAFQERLSYFVKRRLEPGMVVDITARGKSMAALVLSCEDAREEKTNLRSSAYALKKLAPRVTRRIFPQSSIEALRTVAEYHAAPLGIVLAHFTPSAILNADVRIEEAPQHETPPDFSTDCLALQTEYSERVSVYRNIAREAFAKGESVMLLAPTIAEAETLYAELSRGIEEQTLLLTGGLTKKAATHAWNRAVSDPEPLFIILTHSFLTIPRAGVTTLCIERESARSYVSLQTPFLDARIAAEAIARARGTRVIFGDFPLRIETHARLRAHTIDEFGRLQRTAQGDRARVSPRTRIIDARLKSDTVQTQKRKQFSPFTDTVRELLEREPARGSRVFVYAARRGIAPLTICNDCGTPVTDPSTGTPMTLHKTKKGNVFLSFRSGAMLPAETPCRTCGGWNLISLGIGVERVIDEIKKILPETPLFTLTAESANTHAQAKKIAGQFFGTPGSILVGTDRALPYLREPVEYAVVTSIDSALSSGAWRAHMYALHTLFYLVGKVSETTYVQTRLPDAPIIRAFASGNPTDFITQEIAERQKFGYPPFATFIGLSWTGTERMVQETADTLTKALTPYDVVGPLPPRALHKGHFLGRAVIRLEKEAWPDDALVSLLKTFAPQISITVDPDEIV